MEELGGCHTLHLVVPSSLNSRLTASASGVTSGLTILTCLDNAGQYGPDVSIRSGPVVGAYRMVVVCRDSPTCVEHKIHPTEHVVLFVLRGRNNLCQRQGKRYATKLCSLTLPFVTIAVYEQESSTQSRATQDDDDTRGFGLESGKVAEKFFLCTSNLFSIIFQPNGR